MFLLFLELMDDEDSVLFKQINRPNIKLFRDNRAGFMLRANPACFRLWPSDLPCRTWSTKNS
ncbi:MAG: hypothetical protein ACE5L7_10180 [Candidatus Aminicenantales bacterium]